MLIKMLSVTTSAAAAVLIAATLASGAPGGSANQPGCPADHPEAREMAVAFLDGASFAADAAALALTPADTLTMGLLTAPADSTACSRLEAQLAPGVTGPPYVHSFFQVRGYYIIGISVPPEETGSLNADGTITIISKRTFVAVLDSAFHALGVYAL